MHNFNNIKRFLGILAIAATLLVIATIVFRMQKESAPKLSVRKLPVQGDISLREFHYTETKQGVKRWELTAEKAEYNKKADKTLLTGVKLAVAGGGAAGALQVIADRAEYDNDTRDVAMIGNVRGESEKGMRFSTSAVTYVAARSRLETAERVRISDAGSELEGVGMEYQTQTRKFRLMKDVSAVYRPQGGGR